MSSWPGCLRRRRRSRIGCKRNRRPLSESASLDCYIQNPGASGRRPVPLIRLPRFGLPRTRRWAPCGEGRSDLDFKNCRSRSICQRSCSTIYRKHQLSKSAVRKRLGRLMCSRSAGQWISIRVRSTGVMLAGFVADLFALGSCRCGRSRLLLRASPCVSHLPCFRVSRRLEGSARAGALRERRLAAALP